MYMVCSLGLLYFTVWPQPNNPSDVLPNEFTLRLPSGQPSTVVYDVIDSDTGRVVNSFPSNSPRRQTFPGIPSQVYRYGIRARDPVSDQRSPVTSELRFLTPPGYYNLCIRRIGTGLLNQVMFVPSSVLLLSILLFFP